MKTSKAKITELINIESRIKDFRKAKEGKRWKRIEKQALWEIREEELELAVKLARDLEQILEAFDLTEIADLVLRTAEPVEAFIKILNLFGIEVE